MRSKGSDMRHHAWALAPLFIGVVAQILGVPGAFVIGIIGTVIGISLSCAVMAYEVGGLGYSIVRFVSVLAFIACGGILGAMIGSSIESERDAKISEKTPIQRNVGKQ